MLRIVPTEQDGWPRSAASRAIPADQDVLREAPVEQLTGESFHHQVRNALSRLQLALELFEVDAPLSEIQRALLIMALRAAGDLDTMFGDPAADERLLQAIRRSPTGNGTVESAYPAEA